MKPMHFALALSAVIAVGAVTVTANPASATNMADCNKQWNDATAAKTTNGATYQDFLKACLKKGSTAATTTTTTTAAAPAAATTTVAATDTTTMDPAMVKAKKDCNAQWKTAKDAGTTGTQKKKDFVSACLTKAGIPATDAMKAPATDTMKKPATTATTTTATPPAATTTTMAKPATTTTAPVVAATTAAPAEPTDTMAKPATMDANGKPKTAGQLAMDKRIKECGSEWKKAKADGTTNGLKWPQFWSQCDKKLKAAAVTQ